MMERNADARTDVAAWAASLAVVLVSIAVRIRLLDIPLDRDEGEYAYMGSLLLHGIPPYVGAYNMKMPGIYALYALVLSCFGQTPAGIHTGLLITTGVTAVLVFMLGRRIAGTLTGIAAATFFVTLTLNPRALGLAGYAEHYVLPFAVAGALLLRKGMSEGRIVWLVLAGSLFGLGAIVKQSGAAFILFGIAYVAVSTRSLRTFAARTVAVVGGAAIPTAVVAAALGASGAFPRFWFWTVHYAAQYVTQPTLTEGLWNFARTGAELTRGSWPVLLLAACGLVVLSRADLRENKTTPFLVSMLVAAFLGVSAGLYFRQHYFLLLAPALALLGALTTDGLTRHAGTVSRPAAAVAATLCLVVPAGFLVAYEADMFFVQTPADVSRTIYGRNPFLEAVEVARYIRDRAAPDERVAVIGSEPEIYFYARRPAATGYIYMYPLMEPQPYAASMQAEMIHQIEASRPNYLVFVRTPASWLLKPTSDQTILRWLEQYSSAFDRVGVADIVSREVTHYRWDADARDYVPTSPYWVGVYRRRAD
jgi:hypothetical protein